MSRIYALSQNLSARHGSHQSLTLHDQSLSPSSMYCSSTDLLVAANHHDDDVNAGDRVSAERNARNHPSEANCLRPPDHHCSDRLVGTVPRARTDLIRRAPESVADSRSLLLYAPLLR